MYPILVKLGPLTIHTYGLMLAIGFLAALWLAQRRAARGEISPTRITDLCFWLLLGAIIGSRLFYALLNYQEYLRQPLKILQIWEGGLVFHGGIIGAIVMGGWYVRQQKLPFWKVADIVTPSIPLGQAIGRLGCFSAGCCYGRACQLPWGVTFTNPNSLAPSGTPLHPVQLYSSATAALICLLLLQLERHCPFYGQLFWCYLLLSSMGRFGLEFFRGDATSFFIIFNQVFSLPQLYCLGIAFFAVIMLFLSRKYMPQKRRND